MENMRHLIEQDFRKKLPPEIIDEICRYVELGEKPEGLVLAVLTNDLRSAVENSTVDKNILWDTMAYCHNCVPYNAWGSRDAVFRWLCAHQDRLSRR